MEKAKLINLARNLRLNQTDSEHQLWMVLRNRQIGGFKFRRQQATSNFIVDFVCLDAKLVIEIDGGQHDEAVNREKDEQRTKGLETEGYKVIRFWNNDVLENLEGVVFKIIESLKK